MTLYLQWTPLLIRSGTGVFSRGVFGSSAGTATPVDPTHALVANLNYGQRITTTIVGPGPMEEFDAQERQWRPVSDGVRAKLNLVAGGGRGQQRLAFHHHDIQTRARLGSGRRHGGSDLHRPT